jgi:hypothetical protein
MRADARALGLGVGQSEEAIATTTLAEAVRLDSVHPCTSPFGQPKRLRTPAVLPMCRTRRLRELSISPNRTKKPSPKEGFFVSGGSGEITLGTSMYLALRAT